MQNNVYQEKEYKVCYFVMKLGRKTHYSKLFYHYILEGFKALEVNLYDKILFRGCDEN